MIDQNSEQFKSVFESVMALRLSLLGCIDYMLTGKEIETCREIAAMIIGMPRGEIKFDDRRMV